MQSINVKFWMPALVCMLCQGLGIGLVGIFGFFVDPLANEYAVSRTSINSAPILLLIMPAFLSPIIGKLVDRVPIRNILLLGVIIATSCLYAISASTELYLLALGFIGFSAGLVLYGPLSINAFIIKHYQSNTGRVLAIATIGLSIASIILPIWTAWLLERNNWRSALAIIAITVFIILINAIFFGLKSSNKQPAPTANTPIDNVPASFFLTHPAFWLIGLPIGMFFMSAMVLSVCYPAHFANIGFSPMETGVFLSSAGISGLAGKLIVAAFIDRFRSKLKYLASLLVFIQACGMVGILLSETLYPTIASVLLIGLGGGGLIPMPPMLNNLYFDASIIGRVTGAQVPMLLPMGLIGLPLSGYIFDLTGSYQLVFSAMIISHLLAISMLLKLPKIPQVKH